MKFALATLALLFSTSSFAFVTAGSYQGQGKWKDVAGQVGEFKEAHEIQDTDAGTQLTTQLTVIKDGAVVFEETKTITFVEKEYGFFDVKKDGEVVGNGYCFDKICHYAAQLGIEKVEESWTFTRLGFKKVGSTQGTMNGEAFHVSYQGKVRARR